MAKDEMSDKIGRLECPFCGAELEEFGGGDFPLLYYCDNINCDRYHIMGQPTLWQALIDRKKTQDALNKIIAIKESVEGCCAEIQQNCLPLLSSIDWNIKLRIDEETSAIDKYMSEIDEITSITAQHIEN